ncbi:hypothetical protein OROMI_022115 [Orobanche minor]
MEEPPHLPHQSSHRHHCRANGATIAHRHRSTQIEVVPCCTGTKLPLGCIMRRYSGGEEL